MYSQSLIIDVALTSLLHSLIGLRHVTVLVVRMIIRFNTKYTRVDGSASKPALRQDTGYMVEKTDLDIAPYLGPFGAYLMPQ